MRRLASRTALAAAALLAAGCIFTSDDPIGPIAGGTIETTNGLVHLDGRPAARVKVFLLDEKSWLTNVKDGRSVIVDSAETDDSGKFTIKRDTASKVSLMCNAEGHGKLIREFTKARFMEDYRGEIRLEKHVNYRGLIGAGETGAKQVYIVGTPFSAPVDPTGAFTIPNLPPLTYSIVIRRMTPDLSEEFVPAGEVDLTKPPKPDSIPPDTLRPDTSKTVLFEDFEDDNNRSLLGPLEGDGYWDAQNDRYLGGNSSLVSPINAAPQNFMSAIKDGEAPGRAKSLEVIYQAGDRGNDWKPYSFVQIFANIGASTNGKIRNYNLSKMDTLSFWAKGSGRLEVGFLQEQIGVPFKVLATGSVTLTDQWQHFKVAAKDFQVSTAYWPTNPANFHDELIASGLPAYSEKPTTWGQTGGKFRTVQVIGSAGTTFWVDEIRFHGLVLDDLLK